ncbi:metallophosphoesterase, partial [Pasteurella multocida]|nr:metallophosphoesterase [Pasteurella multocida]
MIVFAGDPHGSFNYLYPVIKDKQDVALIIFGYLQLTTASDLEKLAQYCDIWFIYGNHDSKTFDAYESIWESEWQSRNLHGKLTEIQGK